MSIGQSSGARKKRVLFVRISFVPFLLLPVRLLIDSLVERGNAVTLIKTRPRDRNAQEEARPHIKNVMMELFVRRLPKSRLLEPFVMLEFILRSIFHGLCARPDVVVAVDLDTLLPAWLIARMRGVPLVYYSLELYTEREGGFKPKALWVWLERQLINRPELVVACEPNRARFMQTAYGARQLPMVVLNVPKREGLQEKGKIQQHLVELGIQAEFVLYYHGYISRGRCAEVFLEALRELPEGVVLYLVGPVDPAYRKKLEAKARELGLERRVVFRGIVPTEDLLAYAASADAGLQVQLNDGLNHFYCAPIKLFQYFNVGLPVIASNFPGMLEIVEQNQLGLCVEPEDPSALAAAVRQLVEDPAAREAMAQRARQLGQERYCYEVEGDRLLSAIEGLLKR